MVEPLQNLNPSFLQRPLTLIFKNEFKFPPLRCVEDRVRHSVKISPNKNHLLYCRTHYYEGDTNIDYCHYYLFKHLANRLVYIEKFSHIVETNNWNDNKVILDGSRTEWKNQEDSDILDFIDLKMTIHADEIEKNKSLLEGKFKIEGDVSPKEFQIPKFLGDINKCPNHHNLVWDFRPMSFDKPFACECCLAPEIKSRSSWSCYGWYCVECWYFICFRCKKIPNPENTCCPKKHKLNWTKSKQKPPPPSYPKNLSEQSKKIYDAEYKKNLKKNFTPQPWFTCEVCDSGSNYEDGRWECEICDWRLCLRCRNSDE